MKDGYINPYKSLPVVSHRSQQFLLFIIDFHLSTNKNTAHVFNFGLQYTWTNWYTAMMG